MSPMENSLLDKHVRIDYFYFKFSNANGHQSVYRNEIRTKSKVDRNETKVSSSRQL